MTAQRRRGDSRGFTILEMLVSMGIFLLICASAFTLLGVSQRRYQTESQVQNSFEEARLGLDQIVRDINDSGYPPPNQFEVLPDASLYAVAPIAWTPGYPGTPCYIGGGPGQNCTTPGAEGIFIETNPTPQVPGSKVQYIRYKLVNNTLYRGMYQKVAGQTPYETIPDSLLVPFVQNVMNEATPEQIAQINRGVPKYVSGGAAIPVFSYLFDTPWGPLPYTDPRTYRLNTPANIRSVTITLIVMTPNPDAQTGNVRVVELTGRGSRINAFQ